MSEKWKQEQVQPEDINNGNKYTINDQLSLEAVNSIIDNSLYASKTASDAKDIAEEALSFVQEGGTLIIIRSWDEW